MWEMGASADPAAAVTLLILSFLCFIAGAVFRRWPDKVGDLVGTIDGSVWWMPREMHLSMITTSSWALTILSLAALLAAAAIL
ncbi:MAG: hypothetical protein LOD94_16930 [Gammaproteobacteria bacterium]|nr:hypothetical protein [Gammaproteobacteria bacterium]